MVWFARCCERGKEGVTQHVPARVFPIVRNLVPIVIRERINYPLGRGPGRRGRGVYGRELAGGDSLLLRALRRRSPKERRPQPLGSVQSTRLVDSPLSLSLFEGPADRYNVFRIRGGQGPFPIEGERLRPLSPKKSIHLAAVGSDMRGLPTMVEVVRDRCLVQVERTHARRL